MPINRKITVSWTELLLSMSKSNAIKVYIKVIIQLEIKLKPKAIEAVNIDKLKDFLYRKKVKKVIETRSVNMVKRGKICFTIIQMKGLVIPKITFQNKNFLECSIINNFLYIMRAIIIIKKYLTKCANILFLRKTIIS